MSRVEKVLGQGNVRVLPRLWVQFQANRRPYNRPLVAGVHTVLQCCRVSLAIALPPLTIKVVVRVAVLARIEICKLFPPVVVLEQLPSRSVFLLLLLDLCREPQLVLVFPLLLLKLLDELPEAVIVTDLADLGRLDDGSSLNHFFCIKHSTVPLGIHVGRELVTFHRVGCAKALFALDVPILISFLQLAERTKRDVLLEQDLGRNLAALER